MYDFVFEVPWWVIAILLADGAAISIFANRRVNARLRLVGLGLIIAACAWVLVSYLVETELEVVDWQTRDLVRRVVAQDERGMRELLHPRATAGSWNADQIVRGAVFYARTMGLTKARVLSLSRQRRGRDITVRLSVLSEQGTYPLSSVWQLDWQRLQDETWKLRIIAPLQIANMQAEDIENRYLDRPVSP